MPAALSHVSALSMAVCLAWLVGSSTVAQAQTDRLAQAEAALARSDYAPAEAGFRASGEGARARLGLARTLLETGRYDEASRLAHEIEPESRRVVGREASQHLRANVVVEVA